MKFFTLILLTVSFISSAQPNCYVYKEDEKCYEACLEAEKAIQHPQGSKECQWHFERSIELCPTFAYSYFEASVPYLKRGLFVQWKVMIDKAVALDPKAYLRNRASGKFQFLHDYEGAIRDIDYFDSIADFDIGTGSNGMYHLIITKAICFKELNQKDKALSVFLEQLAKPDYSPRPNDLLHLGVLYLELGEYDKAIETLTRQLGINDYLAENYYYIAEAKSKLGDQKGARDFLDKAMLYYNDGKFLKDDYTNCIDRVYREDIESKISGIKKGEG